MRCVNPNCNKDFSREVELFDGRKFCSYCKHDLLPNKNTKLVITVENHQLLSLSERIYHEKWLLDDNDNNTKARFKALDEAIDLCSQASALGNPYAILDMGYYYENGYIMTHKNTAERLRAAYLYYDAVCYNNNQEVILPDGGVLSGKKLFELKAYVAKRMYNVLSKIAAFSRGDIMNADKLQLEFDKINSVLDAYNVDIPKGNADIEKMDNGYTDYVYEVMSMLKSKSRVPLFGLFKLTKEQLQDIDSSSNKSGLRRGKPLGDYINDGKIAIKIIGCNDNGDIVGGIIDLHNSKDIAAIVRDSQQDNFYVFFYNLSGSMRRLNKAARKKIYSTFTKNNCEYIIKMILDRICGYVFAEDDIFKFNKNNLRYDDALEGLIQYAKWEI